MKIKIFVSTALSDIIVVSLEESLRKCNRLRSVDFALVSLIEPQTGRYVDLSENSALFANCLLILQSSDLSYKQQAQQHDFRRRIQTRHQKCHNCAASLWLRRPSLCQCVYCVFTCGLAYGLAIYKEHRFNISVCRVCALLVCSRCRKSGSLSECSSVSQHHQHFASAVSRFKSTNVQSHRAI